MAPNDLVDNEFYREIRVAWHAAALVPVSPDKVEAARITPSSGALLTQVGLPTWVSDLITFPGDDKLLRHIRVAGVDYHVLGDGSGGPIALRADTDEVWALTASQSRTVFVNTHPGFLLLFLGVLLPLLVRLRSEKDPDQFDARIDEVTATFTARDPTALADPDSWWPTVLDEAREGFLTG